ncbi:hypothetical protein Tco_0200239 [Tanacetum coccineum]
MSDEGCFGLEHHSREILVNEARGAKDTLGSLFWGVKATPTIPVSAKENLGDPIDIKMDIIHPEPVAVVAFPAATVVRTLAQHGEAIRGIQEQLVGVPIQEELMALRFRIDIAEAEIASLRARNKTTEAISTVKFATCTRLGAALTWWNGQIRTLGPEAYAMTWEGLKKKMTGKYNPQGEIQKLEIEL